MPWVADYTSRIAPADLKAAGVVGVCRYLSDHSWKVIGQAEYDELRAAGVAILLNWENASTDWMQVARKLHAAEAPAIHEDRGRELGWLLGAPTGATHAASAARMASALGYPPGSPIVGSADFDMTAAQWAANGRAYAVALRDGLHARGFAAGVYGPSDVLGWCEALGGFDVFWQAGMSTSWSGGRNAAAWHGAHLRQRYHQTVGGLDVDHNDILRSDWAGGDMAFSAVEELLIIQAATRINNAFTPVDPYKVPTTRDGSHTITEPNPLMHVVPSASGAGPTDAQVNAAVAAVMNDPAWIAKLGTAVGADLSRRLGNG